MKKSRKDKHFIKQAYYKGGSKALEAFVLKNLQYPQEAFDNKIEGTIHAKYDINMRGKVIKIKLYNSIGYGCDEEVKRLIRLLEFEVPKSRGLRLTFHKEIHIHFRMPKTTNNSITPVEKVELIEKIEESIDNNVETSMNVAYNIIKKTPKTEEEKKDNLGNTYNYTVKI